MNKRSTYRQRVWSLGIILALSTIALYQRVLRPLMAKNAEIAAIELAIGADGSHDIPKLRSELAALDRRMGGAPGSTTDAQRSILAHLGELCRRHGSTLVSALPEQRTRRAGMDITTAEITLSGSLHALLRTVHAWETSDQSPARLVSLDLNTRTGSYRQKPVLHANLIFRTVSRTE